MSLSIQIAENAVVSSKTNIALIGFMGAGKSTVGKALAQKLRMEFVETDRLIVEKTGKTIPQIFQNDGETFFRSAEIEVIREIFERDRLIIACGGGVVLNAININRLRERSVIVYLYASMEEIIKRIRNDSSQRPLIDETNTENGVRSLMRFRAPLYRRSADITINVTNKSVEQIVDSIIDRLIIK